MRHYKEKINLKFILTWESNQQFSRNMYTYRHIAVIIFYVDHKYIFYK